MPRILVIDDEIEFRQLCSALLTNAGYEVTHTDTQEEAENILNNEVINLVITDMMMPNINAPDLIKSIKKQWPNMPIIAVTGTTIFEKKRHTENLSMLGVNHMVEKSPGLSDLVSTVQDLI